MPKKSNYTIKYIGQSDLNSRYLEILNVSIFVLINVLF